MLQLGKQTASSPRERLYLHAFFINVYLFAFKVDLQSSSLFMLTLSIRLKLLFPITCRNVNKKQLLENFKIYTLFYRNTEKQLNMRIFTFIFLIDEFYS